MSTAGAVVLFAFPGSQMGWDAMFASLLAAVAGVPAADAVAVALVVRVQQLLLQVGGALTLLASSRANRDDPGPPVR
jgi:ABC-type Co2+ transport system permease subunit